MMIEEKIDRKMGDNVEALLEKIDDYWYITFKNAQGEPLLIFAQTCAAIMRITKKQKDKSQLLLQVYTEYYILTFSSVDKTNKFSLALVKYVTTLYMYRLDAIYLNRFNGNQILNDSLGK